MIISIVCRQDTARAIDRIFIHRDLMGFADYSVNVRRIRVVFSCESSREDGEDIITCHLSACLPKREPIDVYSQHVSAMQAFDLATERLRYELLRASFPQKPALPIEMNQEA